jgi:hypothetical protein
MSFSAISEDPSATPPEGVVDVRGWEVCAERDDARVGWVSGMIFDETKLRYVEARLENEARCALLPVEYTRADPEHRRVVVLRANAEELHALPTYSRDPASITWEYETSVRRALPAFMAGRPDTGELPAWTMDTYRKQSPR